MTWEADLPYHIVVGMPALSPTMEMGTLAEWYLQEGQSFAAGDAVAKIETDKASIDFEAQDDGVIAKILVEAGTPDVTVGTPIMVTIDDVNDVEKFQDFKVETAATATPPPEATATTMVPPPPSPPPATKSAPPKQAAATELQKPMAAAAPATSSPPPKAPASKPAPTAQSTPPKTSSASSDMPMGWGTLAKTNSPIAKMLSKHQQAYITKYGTTGQLPL